MFHKFFTLVVFSFFIFFQANANATFSACTKMLLHEVKPYLPKNSEEKIFLPEKIITQYDLYFKRGNYYTGALILVNKTQFSKHLLNDLEAKISAEIGDMFSLRIPIQYLEKLAKLPGVIYIETGDPVSPDLSLSLSDTRADSVQLGLGELNEMYNGEGVIIAIIDWGFDYTHPVFYDSTLSNKRLTKAWDQNKMAGPAPTGFDFGTEYSGTQALLNAAEDTLYVFGPGSHGTHVGGIAGGNGAGTPHKGIAPEAELIFISLRRDAPSFTDAVAYVDAYAKSVGKPYVVNMSFGSHLGPHDGSSLKNRAIDFYAGAGSVFVGSAGNNGNNNFHLFHNFAEDGDTLKTVVNFDNVAESFGQTLSMWGSPNSSFSVAIKIADNSNQLVFQTPFYNSVNEPLADDTFFIPNTNDTLIVRVLSVAKSPLNDKPNIRMELRKTTSFKAVLYMTSNDGEVHIWNNVRMNNRYTNWGTTLNNNYPDAKRGNADYGLGEPAGVGKSVITVAAHRAEQVLANGNITFGARSAFSSRGPTVDGRTKPDISAPGQEVVSAVNSFDPDPGAKRATVNFSGKEYHFSDYSGTSMSSPAVAGVVALMLQANPDLSANQVKEIIKATARLDNRTGEIGPEGSLMWGWGKVNALAAVVVAKSVVSVKEFEIAPLNTTLFPNPASMVLNIDCDAAITSYTVYQADGKPAVQSQINNKKTFDINISNLASGIYLLQLNNAEKTIIKRFVKE